MSQLVFSDEGDVATYTSASGREYWFTQSGSTWSLQQDPSSPETFSSFIPADLTESDGTYSLTFYPSNQTQKFNSSGQMTALVDAYGKQITLTYSGPGGALSSLTEPP